MTYSVLDFETRSTVDLKKHGAFVYAAHLSTEPLHLSACVGDEAPAVWLPEKFLKLVNFPRPPYVLASEKRIIEMVMDTDYAVAQNAIFEWLIWNKVMVPRYGWPELHIEKLHDTMAQLAYHALPMNLEQACQVLRLPVEKDMAGNAAMKKLCKPRKPRKAEREADPNWEKKIYWWEEPELMEASMNYCCQDVEAERLVHKTLPDLPPREREVWLHTQKKNMRGLPVDVENVNNIIAVIDIEKARLLKEFVVFTDGAVSGPRSYIALRKWVNEQTGLNLESTAKEVTEKLLEEGNLPANVEGALRIKSQISKSSVTKFQAMLDRKNEDNRVQGWSAYHAASTGRFAAWGLQVHNFPRVCYKPSYYEQVTELFREFDTETMGILWDNPFNAASKCIRGAICAPEGREFVCTDFSAIEGRGLAYLAGEQWVLDAYKAGIDMYKVSASELFGVPHDKVTKDQRQVGKVEELMLGYGGGIGAFATGAKTYNVDLETLPALVLPHATKDELDGQYGAKGLAKTYLSKNPEAMSMNAAIACDVIKRKWRAARPITVKFWKQLENAAKEAVKNPGQIFSCRDIKYIVRREFLMCRLPSGRVLHYYQPRISMKETDWGESASISFMGMKIVDGETTRKWVRLFTYGGKLSENITQAFCRDLLTEAMLRHEAAGYPIIMDVHDEDMAEMPIGKGNLEEFNRIAEIVPSWAKGMPIKAEGWVGTRYRK